MFLLLLLFLLKSNLASLKENKTKRGHPQEKEEEICKENMHPLSSGGQSFPGSLTGGEPVPMWSAQPLQHRYGELMALVLAPFPAADTEMLQKS